MNVKTLILICTIIPAFAIIIDWMAMGGKYIKKIWYFISRRKPKIPRETLRIVIHRQENWWGMGTSNKQPAMQISGHLYVTNITDIEVKILRVVIIKPKEARRNCIINHVLTRHPIDNIYGSYSVLPNKTSEVSIDLWVQPPVIQENEDLKLSISLIDQFNNQHKVKNLLFHSSAKKKAMRPKEKEIPKELIYKIKNPIEKDIASTLKAEVERYKACGRRVGGLGSVTLKGSNSPGLGTEWRKTDSPLNQSIDQNPQGEKIVSDNATALVNLYNKLSSIDDKQIFIDALLKRISRDTEYAPIGYLILLVLFRLNKFTQSLSIARSNLHKDSAHGFSDFVRLLDGLLRHEHPKFTEHDLNKVEEFIDGLDEHVFYIPERLSAIRAYRLAKIKNNTD